MDKKKVKAVLPAGANRRTGPPLHSRILLRCACGGYFQFPEFHWPHCAFNPANVAKTNPKLHAKLEQSFTRSELASISTHGPVRDEPLKHKKKGTYVRGKKGKA